MPIDAMHKELLVRMSLFLGNKDRAQLGCTAKPFKNLDIEKALCSESVTIDHSLLIKIRCYHNEIMKIRANETSSSATSSRGIQDQVTVVIPNAEWRWSSAHEHESRARG